MKTIAVYCGSNKGFHEEYISAAKEFGKVLGEKNMNMVYGGGGTGMMGAVSNAAVEAGCRVTGVIPSFFHTDNLGNKNITESIVVDTMHERKQMMADLADAFVALPGGYGTMEELFEVLTWQQIKLHNKPIGILNINNYYSPFISMVNKMVQEGFLHDANRSLICIDEDPRILIDKLSGFKPTEIKHWFVDVR